MAQENERNISQNLMMRFFGTPCTSLMRDIYFIGSRFIFLLVQFHISLQLIWAGHPVSMLRSEFLYCMEMITRVQTLRKARNTTSSQLAS